MAQMQDHFISSGKRSEWITVFNDFCIERISFASQGGATAPALWPFGQVSAFVSRELPGRVIIVSVMVRLTAPCWSAETSAAGSFGSITQVLTSWWTKAKNACERSCFLLCVTEEPCSIHFTREVFGGVLVASLFVIFIVSKRT